MGAGIVGEDGDVVMEIVDVLYRNVNHKVLIITMMKSLFLAHQYLTGLFGFIYIFFHYYIIIFCHKY